MIESDEIRLDPLKPEHAAALSKWTADPDTWSWWTREPPTSPEKMEASIQRSIQEQSEGERQAFAVFSECLQAQVGETSFWFRKEEEVEIGSTWLCRKLRGTGFNRKAKALLIERAFQDPKVKRIILQTDVLNLRSQKAILSLGAR